MLVDSVSSCCEPCVLPNLYPTQGSYLGAKLPSAELFGEAVVALALPSNETAELSPLKRGTRGRRERRLGTKYNIMLYAII